MSDFSTEHNRVVWFDLEVNDLERAVAFYKAVLAIDIRIEEYDGFRFATLDHDQGNGGCLVPTQTPIEHQQQTHLLMYLNVAGRLEEAVAQVEANGGQVAQGIHNIGPFGQRAIINDTEGNRIALHSPV